MPDLIKPFRLSCMQNMQTIAGKTYLYATVFFGFGLLDPGAVLSEAQYLETATGSLPAGGFLDMGFPKGAPEVLIAGEARAPAGTSVKAREVSVTVGPFFKRAMVIGDRFWVKDNGAVKLTDATPFEAMPLLPERAFGNEKHPVNPLGRGCEPDVILERLGYAALPNIENPRQLIAHRHDRPEPVFFGPLSHEHPLRKAYLGTPDHQWIRTSFPDPPPGFDKTYFNVAPADQRFKQPLIGDEQVAVSGMSSDHPSIASRLPGLRIRLFAVHDKEASRLTEIAVKLETVWIFGTAEIGGLYYRGAIKVADKQASDVVALVIGAERLAETPRPGDYYAGIYRLRTDPKEGAMQSLNDLQLMPPLSEADAKALEARSAAYSEEVAQKFEKQFANEAEQMVKRSGMPDMMLPDMEMPKVPRLPLARPEDIAAGRVDIAGLVRGLHSTIDAAQIQADATRTAYLAEHAASGVPIPPDMRPKLKAAVQSGAPNLKALFEKAAKGAGAADNFSAKGRELVARANANAASAVPADAGPPPGTEARIFSQIDEILAKIPSAAPAGDEEELFRIARARALALPEADPFYQMQMRLKQAGQDLKAASAAEGKGSRVSPDEALAKVGGGQATDLNEVDAELKKLGPPQRAHVDHVDALLAKLLPKSAGQDLPPVLAIAKAHQSMPAPKQQMRSVDDIIGKVQAASSMTEASFFEQLDGEERAFFAEGDHERSQMPEAAYPLETYTPSVARRLGDLVIEHVGKGEVFARRDIAGADLSNADLSDLNLAGTFLERAKLNDAVLKRSAFVAAALTGADLSGADASGSDFTRANISQIVAHRARFDNARFSERIVLSPDLEAASFKNARFKKMMFHEGALTSADFEGAGFESCFFFKCDLSNASLRKARFEKCMFMECVGSGSDWSQARFERVLMSKVKAPQSRWSGAAFSKSSFVGNAELSRSFFDGITGHLSSFLEASLDESCFMRADIPEVLFLKCSMSGIDFRAARARRAVFSESVLIHTDFFASDLMEAQLGACDARQANFRGSNLFSANLTDTKVAGADLSQANLGQTVLELPTT